MSIEEGRYCYALGDAETRDWFHRQWLAWPNRVDERMTTSAQFHYGAALSYQIEHGEPAPASRDFYNAALAEASIRKEPCPVEPLKHIHTPNQPGRRARRRMK